MPVPDIEFRLASKADGDHSQPVTGRWRSKAILKALDNVKRAEMFESLRKANESVTMT